MHKIRINAEAAAEASYPISELLKMVLESNLNLQDKQLSEGLAKLQLVAARRLGISLQ
jgi:hypothetical protein